MFGSILSEYGIAAAASMYGIDKVRDAMGQGDLMATQ